MRKEVYQTTLLNDEKHCVYSCGSDDELIALPKEMLNDADINYTGDIKVECEPGKIIITSMTVMGRIPQELLDFYESIGFSKNTVEQVIGDEAEKAGGYDKLIEKLKTEAR